MVTDRPTERGARSGLGPVGSGQAPAGSGAARRQLVVLVLGVGAVVLGSVVAGTELLGRILEPPFPVGLLLAAAAALIGVVVLLRAVTRVGAAREDAQELIRAVRLAFVAVGCFAAASGWLVGSALPIVVGLIIVGIDVIETTFLLMITASREPAVQPPAPRD